jgi:formylglycine-generating enzyme required for sulfatase activity
VAFWETIKTSTNPEDFREYLKKYPNGEFAGLARNRLSALETAAKEEAARKEEAKKEEAQREEAKRKEEAEKKRAGTVVKNSIGMELVYVPSGSFMIGSENGEAKEKPVHQVTIREGFYMGRYEVTQAQWQTVMGNNPSPYKGENLPVGNVSWDDAQEFIRRMNALGDSYKYRLPSEAEWEYGCRAGTTGDYAGNLDSMAWHAKNRSGRSGSEQPVGQKQPNAFGLYDMHGNVDEWCQDKFYENYNGAPTNGSAWEGVGTLENIGLGDFRVHRGGSYLSAANDLRCASRTAHDRSMRLSAMGFRVVAVARTR